MIYILILILSGHSVPIDFGTFSTLEECKANARPIEITLAPDKWQEINGVWACVPKQRRLLP